MRAAVVILVAAASCVVLSSATASSSAPSQGTALVVATSVTKTKSMSRPGTISLRGSFHLATGRGSGSVDMSDYVRADGAEPDIARLFKGSFVATSDTNLFMSLKVFELFPGTKPWLHTPIGAARSDLDFASVYATPRTPIGELAAFRRAGARPAKVGEATVSGVATTRYHLTVNIVQAVSTFAPAKSRARAVAAAKTLVKLTDSPTQTCDLWVDRAGTAWRERCTMIEQLTEKPQEFGKSTDTATVLKFGVAVTANVPADDQVMSEAQWERAASGQGSSA